jgi:hypothetical protein
MSNLMIKLSWQVTFVADPSTLDGTASAVARPRHGQVVVIDDAQAHRRPGVDQLA